VVLLGGSMTVACVRGAGGTAAESRPAVTRFSLDDHVYVLLWTDAQLYRSRDDRNPVRAYDFGGVSRQERAGEVFLARLVEDHGAWLKVVTGPLTWWDNGRGRSLHCAGTGVVDSAWGLELWIRAQDTAPVLAERLSRSYPDGTSVDLDPGTPIVEGHPWVDGFSFRWRFRQLRSAPDTPHHITRLLPATRSFRYID
jgi:hypothetical protein